MFHANAVAVWARMVARVPTRVVVSDRVNLSRALGDYPAWKRVAARFAVRRSYPKADALIAVSAGVAEDIVRHFDASRTPVHVVPNPNVTPDLVERAKEHSGCAWLDADGAPT